MIAVILLLSILFEGHYGEYRSYIINFTGIGHNKFKLQ